MVAPFVHCPVTVKLPARYHPNQMITPGVITSYDEEERKASVFIYKVGGLMPAMSVNVPLKGTADDKAGWFEVVAWWLDAPEEEED